MNREHILAVLYDLTLTIGSEVRLAAMLTKLMQRLLYHTSFPVGVVLLDQQPQGTHAVQARMATVVGDHRLSKHQGQEQVFPVALVQGKTEFLEDTALLGLLPGGKAYGFCLKLVVDAETTLLLLAPHRFESKLPLLEVFRPVLRNLTRAIQLCRDSEKLTNELREDRNKALAKLQESELHFRTLANSGSALIWTSDTQGQCDYFNEPWFLFTGRSMAEEQGMGWLEGVHPEDRTACARDFLAALTDRVRFQIEYRIRRADGEYRWVRDEGCPRYDAQGAFIGYIGYCMDVTERRAADDEITRLAFYDQLTGLPNRRLLLDRLNQAFSSTERQRCHGALMMIDLDNFKALNDTLGHQIGDELLQQVAARISQAVRRDDTAARLGGDEFVVLLKDLSADEALAAQQTEAIAKKILIQLAEPYFLGAHSLTEPHFYHHTASIGLALFKGMELSSEDLVMRADTAMYQAKAAGRNVVKFFDPEIQAAVAAKAALEADMREGIVKTQFVLYYQPQVNRQGDLVGAEVLLRWPHPVRGFVSPADFIPVAEGSGLILPLGYWVLQSACEQLARWRNDPVRKGLTLAVNVSAKQLSLPMFTEEVMGVLEFTGAPPNRLKLELTESVLLENTDDIIHKMQVLRDMGVTFSIDDFGTGYSSLSYLKRLPADQLKIDQSFVRDLLDAPNDLAIVKMVVGLGKSLGMEVIAEGVETEQQRVLLGESGCQCYQGYLFGRPIPLVDFEAYASSTQH